MERLPLAISSALTWVPLAMNPRITKADTQASRAWLLDEGKTPNERFDFGCSKFIYGAVSDPDVCASRWVNFWAAWRGRSESVNCISRYQAAVTA